MHERVIERLQVRMASYEDLVALLPQGALLAELPVPSNTIGAQLWCVVGARESYARAIQGGAWSGFSCSLTAEAARRTDGVLATLRSSSADVMRALGDLGGPAAAAREGFVVDLLEHEAQHQGQLIRYVYGLGYEFPDSWRSRWALA